MFGLMKVRSCSLSNEARANRQRHYCGTCKALGSHYGARARLLLNHDTVFLAELLSALSFSGAHDGGLSRSLRSFNCLAVPAADKPLPFPLSYAAAAAVTLAEWKLADRFNDSRLHRWRLVQRLYAPCFRSATARLTSWKFPLHDMRAILVSQEERESTALHSTMSADGLLDDLAEPTALATALFFSHAATLADREECKHALYRVGRSLGSIVYLLDAVEDFSQDRQTGNFNALRCAFSLTGSDQQDDIPATIRSQVIDKIQLLQLEFEQALVQLPLDEADRARFTDRLCMNLKRTLGVSPVPEACRQTDTRCTIRMNIGQRWRHAVQFGDTLSQRFLPAPSAERAAGITHHLARPVMFATILPVVFFAPRQAAAVDSYRECMSLGFNVMFIGAVVTALLQMTYGLLPVSAPLHFNQDDGEQPVILKGRKNRPAGAADSGGWCDGCGGCDCCCDCDGCSGCDCGSCDCNCDC